MRFAALRDMWPLLACAVLMACSPTDPIEMESGHTTTTYGSSASSSSATTIEPSDTSDDGEPPDPTDTGPTAPPPPPPVLDLGGGGVPGGQNCTSDQECDTGNCYVIPFLGGYCGECNEDADCPDGGCTPPNPFDPGGGSYCNMGEYAAGCESDAVCMNGLVCSTALSLLGLIDLTSCGTCTLDAHCNGNICAPLVDLPEWSGVRECIPPNSLPQDAYCDLEGNGDAACESGVCSQVDIMGLALIGACGECNSDADCVSGSCIFGELVLDSGGLFGSHCG